MPLVAYVPDPLRYQNVFDSIQGGDNPTVRYRGAAYQNGSGFPQILKSLLAKLINFARPMISAAAPHARKAFEAATPHLQEAAAGAVKDITNRTVGAISKRLSADETQAGQGLKRQTGGRKTSSKRLRRIPPRNIPDFF